MIIVIEGGDQAGKKTQSQLLANALRKRKIKTKVFSFPDYSTPIGKEIKKYLNAKRRLPIQVVHCLLAANRWEKLKEIKDAISKNSVLILVVFSHKRCDGEGLLYHQSFLILVFFQLFLLTL